MFSEDNYCLLWSIIVFCYIHASIDLKYCTTSDDGFGTIHDANFCMKSVICQIICLVKRSNIRLEKLTSQFLNCKPPTPFKVTLCDYFWIYCNLVCVRARAVCVSYKRWAFEFSISLNLNFRYKNKKSCVYLHTEG